jgi:hypothetical protein
MIVEANCCNNRNADLLAYLQNVEVSDTAAAGKRDKVGYTML